jgi:hypothetical protein
MDSPSCRTCRHWTPSATQPRATATEGVCEQVGVDGSLFAARRPARIVSLDGGAFLVTGPGFGCSEYEPGEER